MLPIRYGKHRRLLCYGRGMVRRMLRDLVGFALANKVYWVLPLVLVALLAVGLLATSSPAAAPHIYSVH